MIKIFQDLGFDVKRELDDDIISVRRVLREPASRKQSAEQSESDDSSAQAVEVEEAAARSEH
jgi:hypothetical protein